MSSTSHDICDRGDGENWEWLYLSVFFLSGKKSNDKDLISIKMLLFLRTIMTSGVNVPVTRVSSYLWQWGLSGSSAFTFETSRSMFVNVSCKTLKI